MKIENPDIVDKLFDENLRIVFNLLDTERIGKVSLAGFLNALLAFGQSMTEEEVVHVLQSRGHKETTMYALDFEEFKSLVKEKATLDTGELTLKSLVDRLLVNEDIVARMFRMRSKKGFLCDMDGVIYRGGKLLPGVRRFLSWVNETKKKFLFITNNSKNTPAQLQSKLSRMGLDLPEDTFFTAALSCAAFLKNQKPHGCTAYCVGGLGIQLALQSEGVILTSENPDYVVIGESDEYTSEQIKKATNLVYKGAKLIGTNIDVCGPIEDGIEPSCGAWTSVIEKATGKKAYFTGKPNPFMMRAALSRLECHSSEVSMVGDRMDTDCIAGLESMLDPILVLSGVSSRTTVEEYPYRPYIVLNGVGEIPPEDFKEPL